MNAILTVQSKINIHYGIARVFADIV